MNFNVYIEKNDGIIIFNLTDREKIIDATKETIELFEFIVKCAKKYKCNKILIDASNLEYKIFISERYGLGKYASEMCIKYNLKIACIKYLSDEEEFPDILMHNLGVNFKFFKDRIKALDWLKE